MDKYYTVEQVSDLLSMHPKTIQRYIREGKLQAKKVGKGWRIAGHDLSTFAEGSDIDDVGFDKSVEDKITISTVIDINVSCSEESIRITNMLTGALNSKQSDRGKSVMHTQYIEHEKMLRVTLWGGITFVQKMLDIISIVVDQSGRS